MLVRVIHALAAAAVLIQCSPLRACAVAKLALGANCHDRDLAGLAHSSCDAPQNRGLAAAAQPHHGPDHDHVCACEHPKSPADAAKLAAGAAAGATALAPQPAPAWSIAPPAAHPLIRPEPHARALAPVPPAQLPLLC